MTHRSAFVLVPALVAAGCGSVADRIDRTPAANHDAPPLGVIVVTEVAATGAPEDWFEVANDSDIPVDLERYVFVDRSGDLDRAGRFLDVTLAPGERYVQRVSVARNGFALGRDEALWIYREGDGRVSDVVGWHDGEVPAGATLRIDLESERLGRGGYAAKTASAGARWPVSLGDRNPSCNPTERTERRGHTR